MRVFTFPNDVSLVFNLPFQSAALPVGPLRMAYGRNISVVRFVAGLMSDMVQDIYGYLPHDAASKERN